MILILYICEFINVFKIYEYQEKELGYRIVLNLGRSSFELQKILQIGRSFLDGNRMKRFVRKIDANSTTRRSKHA